MEPHTWFRKCQVAPGTVISLTSPAPSTWRIISKVNEKEHQMDEEDIRSGSQPSFAAIKLLCHDESDPNPNQQALMRIYQQIPWIGTEIEPARIRAPQATSYTHIELEALRNMTEGGSDITPKLLAWSEGKQDEDGVVPGGYLTHLVWEIVPGVCLGKEIDPAPFWELPREQRDAVRTAFENGYNQMMSLGYYPIFAAPRNLVWNWERRNLYFVGFFDCKRGDIKYKWNIKFLPQYGLVKVPDRKWCSRDWNGDTSGWEF
ncbi:hypothetical protein ASPZODRAFT_66845 [Penicilliopsis zonata CBS 506.65]|uniref:Aminoglycoside phosphotransferase domain-containing protein n=1 Tax=Penicilliopsis zonata CBS 506.65 TaxID=1073090 RepID=A0A1L9SGP6_9EURO|nr:hypothetical protein ASPZODRAFT_66845 [Penicilliopsis zonata CBS 506.65]OJJ46445.1 hypothetical protein ASPZODRAFT_66845 [Penicilliopsis zonata CBS 506.65]